MGVKHAYNQTVGDGTATSVVRPSDWNSLHPQTIALAGNTLGSSQIGGNDITFVGGNNLTLSADTGASQLVFVGPPSPDRYFKEIIQGERLTTVVGLSATNISNRPLILPFWMEGTGLQLKTARLLMSFGASSNRSLGGTFHVGVYSIVNATQMTLLASDSFSVSSTASASSASWNGPAWVDFTNMSNVTLTAEGSYALALMVRPVSANVTWMPVSLYGADNMPNVSRVWSNQATAALNATHQFIPFWGAYSTTTAAMPASLGLSQINGASSISQYQFYAALKEI